MKCSFCSNEEFQEKINADGILESWCTDCLDKEKIRIKLEQIK